jgi:2-keto-4-pentenoate hydratase/2-oxohepta-3-ene-1,7-dioic acid hydratase in catechol pathway
MKILSFRYNGKKLIGLLIGDEVANLTAEGAGETLDEVLCAGSEALKNLATIGQKASNRIPLEEISEWLPPVTAPKKAIAVGLNYADHAAEGHLDVPEFPVLFSRYPSSWVGHKSPILKPKVSNFLDYEGEMVVVIGKEGRYVSKADALSHVAGYSIFNEGSVRDFQMRTHQWTIGKNFDKSGSFGPYFVSADELPAGAKGLQLKTRLNGEVLQNANTNDMVFDVATLVSVCSQAFSLTPGDIIISGTPSGVGGARKPPIFMQPGDICEISIEGLGVLSNMIEDE